jgi:AbrB family looped-hinge helix DNA binding protein
MSDPEPDRRILASSTLTRNYQVTIPKPVRARFRFEEGDLVVFILEEGRLLIEKG